MGKSSFIYRYTHNDFTDTLSVMKTLTCPTCLPIFHRLLRVHTFRKSGDDTIFLFG